MLLSWHFVALQLGWNLENRRDHTYLVIFSTSFLPPCRYEVELEGLKDEYAKTLEDAKKEKVLPNSALISVMVEI